MYRLQVVLQLKVGVLRVLKLLDCLDLRFLELGKLLSGLTEQFSVFGSLLYLL